jgi:hypothetical protein
VIKNGVMMSQDEFRAQVIRECIDAIPVPSGLNAHGVCEPYRICREALKSLLPKDRAKELVEAYRQTFDNHNIVATMMDDELDFARWLITNNHVKEG